MDALTLLSYSAIFVTMVYGPIAAFSCEMFPVKEDIHQCLTVPRGNGIFGGLLQFLPILLQQQKELDQHL
jgi:hypothetical protein